MLFLDVDSIVSHASSQSGGRVGAGLRQTLLANGQKPFFQNTRVLETLDAQTQIIQGDLIASGYLPQVPFCPLFPANPLSPLLGLAETFETRFFEGGLAINVLFLKGETFDS
jgi:hypothetical protein